MTIFAPPLRRSLQELRDDPDDRVWRKDIRSADWDGGADLSGGPDTAATKGYFVDYSTGRAQFGTLYVAGVERIPAAALVSTSETTTSTDFTDLATAGPAVTITTGTVAEVTVSCNLSGNGAGVFAIMGYAITGASSHAAQDPIALIYESSGADDEMQSSWSTLRTDLTAGSNTFTAEYRVTSGTGKFSRRNIHVVPYG